jgi:translation initiation factor IF-2
LDDAKQVLTSLLEPEIVTTELGKLVIKGIFRTTKDEIICGGEVTKGKAEPGTKARVIRDKEQIAEVEVISVKRGVQEAKEVFEGEMCGLQLKVSSKLVLEEGDRLEFFKNEEVQRTL